MTKTLAPEVGRTADGWLAVRVVIDTDVDCTPLGQRRYARFVEFVTDDFRDEGSGGFRITLHPVATKSEYAEPTYDNAPVEVWSITPGRCSLYVDAGKMAGGEWETTLDRVEELGRALLSAVAEARARKLFE